MKSIKGQGAAACPNCGENFDAEFWSLVRGDADAELKDSLLGGELNLISCPACGAFFYHDRNIIYFDPPNELLAFVSPGGDKKDFEAVKAKMKRDFKTLKENLASMNISYEPFYLAGLEELKAMLDYEAAAAAQSEVIAALSAQLGFKLAALRRAGARVSGYPFYLPVDGGAYTREGLIKAAQAVLKQNPALNMLETFIKDMQAGKELPPRI
ncbi:MAG: CpXC domain-containing protein [Elusimicrobiota bacterium]|jgi:hypothetical protein|nr:CpXC domain-containing protein [Elusimicrobiota bacterium]